MNLKQHWEELKAQWNAEETKLGKFLKKEFTIACASLTVLCHIADAEIVTKVMALPVDWVPDLLKYSLTFMTFLAPILGKLTVK